MSSHGAFAITGEEPNMISLHGERINLFIESGHALGPVFEVTVANVEEAKLRLHGAGLSNRQGRARTFRAAT